ncbi:MAG: MATE family efflux transporter [Gemmatimonadota bacterium]
MSDIGGSRSVKGARGWARLVWEAASGRTADATKGPLGEAIVLLAVPMVLEMVMESVFAVVDIFFVSRRGADAMTAVGLTESMMTLIYTVAIGLSIGVTAVVARRTGEGDTEGAARAAGQAILLGVAMSALIAVFAAPNAHRLLRLMGASESVVATGGTYTGIMFGGNAVILLLFLMNAAFRGAGDAAVAMRVLWLANAINIVLDPLLIFGIGPFPELGVTGAAVATNIGRGTAVLVQLWLLLKGIGKIHVYRRHLRVVPDVMGRVLKLSATGTLQTFIGTASYVGLVRIVAEFGSEAVAGYTIAIRIVLFALLPAWGLANAAATMVGQSLGAQDPDRAERSVWIAGRMNLAFLGTVGVIFVIAAPLIVGWFGGEGDTSAHAVTALRIISLGFVFYSYGMVLTNSFNGAGDTWTPTVINLVCFWLWEIPLAWFLAFHTDLGPTGAFVAITVAFSTLAVVSAVVFRRGRWKAVVV